MVEPPIITEPDEISAGWLTAVLREAGHSMTVTATSHAPIGTGLMARSHRFRMEGRGDGPETLVLKFPSGELGTRELGANAYKREVGFYRDVAQTITTTIPACLHAAVNGTGQKFVLVLEDVDEAEVGDQIAGCSPEEAHRSVLNLARLHASTWHDEALLGHAWVQDDIGTSLVDYMALAIEAFEPRFGSLLDAPTLPVLREFSGRSGIWKDAQPPTRALVHGDYRIDNLLFSTTSGAVTALDWQTVSYVSPGRDLAYFLGNSLTVDARRNVEADLVDAYLDELECGGVVGYTRGQCWEDLRHGAFQGPLVTMLGAFTAERTDRSEQMFAVMANRSVQQILDLDSMALIR